MRADPYIEAPEPRLAGPASDSPITVDSIVWDPSELLNTARRHLVLLTVIALTGAAVAGSISLLTRRTFTSSGALLPQGRTAPAGFSSLASQLGLGALGGGDIGQGAQFYVELLGSRYTIREVVGSSFRSGSGQPTTIADALALEAQTPALRRERTVDYLARHLALSSSPKTGVVRISVSLPDSALPRQIVARFMELADKFNMERRQTQARAERVFVEHRSEEATSRLREAETRMQAFLQENRDYRAPALQVSFSRLEREVARDQQALATLQAAYEQARIEEVRNTPVISVLEPPDEPIRPDPRNTFTKAVLGALLAFVTGLAVVHHRDRARRRSA